MFEAYSVGVRISVINGVGSSLLGLARQFKGAGLEASALNREIKSISRTLLIGGGLSAAGLGILAMFKPALDQAKRFQTETTKFATFGLGDAMNMQAVKFAKSTKVMGASYLDLMHNMVESQGVFREAGLGGMEALAGAKLAAPVLAKIHFANSALNPEEAGRRDTSALAMLRFIEMRGGVKDAGTFNRIADLGFKAINSSGGNISWENLRQFMARGGVAAQGISDQVLFGKLEPVIGELKGSTAGNAWMTAYNRLQGIVRLPNQVAHELARNGIWDESKIVWNSQGGIKSFKSNPLRDQALFSSDPVAFYQKNILPMYGKMGLDQNGRNRENALIFGRTGGAFFSLIDRQQKAIGMSVGAQAKAFGIDAAVKAAGGTMVGKQIALQKQWANLMEQTGEVVLPIAVKALEALLPPLTAFSNWASAHPRMFGFIIDGIGLLGAALLGGGVVTSLVGAAGAFRLLGKVFIGPLAGVLFRGGLAILGTGLEVVGAGLALLSAPVVLTIAGLTALGLAIWQIAKHWDSSKSIIGNIKSELGLFFSWLWNLAADLINKIPGMHVGRLLPGGSHFPSAKDMSDFAHGGKSGASPYVAPGGHAQKQPMVGDVHIDGQKAGKVIWRHQNTAMGRVARSSAGDFDPTQSLSPVSLGYAT